MPAVPVVQKCRVRLDPPQIEIGFSADQDDRDSLQQMVKNDPKRKRWVATQLCDILLGGEGDLAVSVAHPMRTPAASVLPIVTLKGTENAILRIRASNRGSPWPVRRDMEDVLTWKEFAGIIDAIDDEADPTKVATKALYEQLSLVCKRKILLPRDVIEYPGVEKTTEIAMRRANKYYAAMGNSQLKTIDGFIDQGYQFEVE